MRMVLDRHFAPQEILSINPYLRNQEARDVFLQLPLEQQRRIKLIRNHFSFGVHQGLNRPSTYITLLREPLSRVVSHYNFIRQWPKEVLHETVITNNLSLEDLLHSGLWLDADNGQVRQLSSAKNAFSAVRFGECSRDMLEQAKSNLREYFVLVGLTERFDETLLLLRRALGWNYLFYVRRNIGEYQIHLDEIPQSARVMLENSNKLDVELYAFAEKLFQENVDRYGVEMRRDLEIFARLNSLYNNLYQILSQGIRPKRIRRLASKFA